MPINALLRLDVRLLLLLTGLAAEIRNEEITLMAHAQRAAFSTGDGFESFLHSLEPLRIRRARQRATWDAALGRGGD